MTKIHSKNTGPEKKIRSVFHRLGLRFRLHSSILPGSPDIVFPKWKIAVFVHGCFWHSCKLCDKGLRRPSSNIDFWDNKLAQNKARDKKVEKSLKSFGWRVLVIWECQIKNNKKLLVKIKRFFRNITSFEAKKTNKLSGVTYAC